jgi:hypothetical protein
MTFTTTGRVVATRETINGDYETTVRIPIKANGLELEFCVQLLGDFGLGDGIEVQLEFP